jgi:hypothetical protein
VCLYIYVHVHILGSIMFKHTLNVSVDKSLVSIVGVGSQVLTSDHPELDCCLPLLTM